MAESARVSPRKRYTFWIDDHQATALATIHERDGILPSEQIRRALDEWFVKRGVTAKSDRKRASTRKRP
jgi:hypothetical protein